MRDTATTSELSSRYDPSGIEPRLYAHWEEAGYFHVDAREAGRPYVIAIPPPNVTAALHMGHGLNNTIQDVLIRHRRMMGDDALWIPGTDHAGIATQNVVERKLAEEGMARHDLGREEFVRRVWAWVDEYGGRIIEQLRVIGCSCDWTRTRFTLDEGLSRAVREVFVRLYEKGLVYRGRYIINWCPRCGTALANEEAVHREVAGQLYRIRYPLADRNGQHLVVATTRPETMLGDTAVAAHPGDARHRELVGLEAELPLTGRRIPIIADEVVDPEFGSGLVKVTPAHDPNDFEIGRRHGLPSIDVMNPDATMSDAAPEPYRGLGRFEARARVVRDLERAGLLEGVEPYTHAVGHCYRCDTLVEPRLSLQWFVRMRPLAEPALEAYLSGRLRFHPERFGHTYRQWMETVRDWCISRQIWWGHRIPVWYCRKEGCGEILVAREDPTECGRCGGPVEQDPDVLDTWFSAWLWPFSTLGWPEGTNDLKVFYPTNTLVTAPEILFFWVARMVMAGLEFMGELPFTDVLLNGTVRDKYGRRMSKSLGNGIDPLEVVERFGADAMRFTLVSGASLGTDLQLDHEDLEATFRAGRNFTNKVWNAVRFALPYLSAADLEGSPFDRRLELADRWILSRFARAVSTISEALDRFRLHEAAGEGYQFVWSEFCDWYLELVKPRLRGERGEESRAAASATLARVVDGWLRLLHPMMPFITEELACSLPGRPAGFTLVRGPWPRPWAEWRDEEAERSLEELQELIGAVRLVRAEYHIDPGREVPVVLGAVSDGLAAALDAEERGLRLLARVSSVSRDSSRVRGEPGAHSVLRSGTTLFIPLRDLVDVERERKRLEEELRRVAELLAESGNRLQSSQFLERAPAEVVEREREKRRSLEERHSRLLEKRAAFGPVG
ncbi:MAG: valine--tRNA ligase [Gemmatimonadota bacterium]